MRIDASKLNSAQTHRLLKSCIVPRPIDLKGFYRLRVGDYRIIFEILVTRKVVAVHSIVPRGKAYR